VSIDCFIFENSFIHKFKEREMKMKNVLVSVVFLTALVVAGRAEASLTAIGTANYLGSDYNLIYDKESSLIWLDYSHAGANWDNQAAWARGLGITPTLTNINLNSGYSGVNWSSDWRLPTTENGSYSWSFNGTSTAGYSITSSELGHLYYTELGNKGYYDTNGNANQLGYGLINTGLFANLKQNWYWSSTECADSSAYAWYFDTVVGEQFHNGKFNTNLQGIAVRSGQVVEAIPTPTPIPAAAWLFGSGLIGLAGFSRKGEK
jgi:hypothetical protein